MYSICHFTKTGIFHSRRLSIEVPGGTKTVHRQYLPHIHRKGTERNFATDFRPRCHNHNQRHIVPRKPYTWLLNWLRNLCIPLARLPHIILEQVLMKHPGPSKEYERKFNKFIMDTKVMWVWLKIVRVVRRRDKTDVFDKCLSFIAISHRKIHLVLVFSNKLFALF